MKIEIKRSGDKSTLKITPDTVKEQSALTRLLGKPDPEKGEKNPQHWHVKLPKEE